ncbi:MAG: N-ethylmaleimide reductase [Rhodospirillaceae bacterium]|nr:N-ethylmaleimide reductase [Rhodospirillaceae bacterium]
MTDHGPATSEHLLRPIEFGTLTLNTRIVMAPMTRNRADADDAPHALNVQYYAQRAAAGLIITEASQISPQGKGYPGTPGIYSRRQIAGWRLVTDAVHDHGGKIFLQLWHVGRISHPMLQPGDALPVAPSALQPAGEAMTPKGPRPFVTPRALETAEIAGIVADFRQAALNAKEAGFNGVELHGANGYLIDQFLRSSTNRRSDRYGGPVESRARLLLEVTDAIVDAFGKGRVGVRLSPLNPYNDMSDDDPPATFGYAAEQLGRRALAYLHISQGGDDGHFDWQALRRTFGGHFMINGGYDVARAEAALASGGADLVAFGVPFLANPDLVERFRRGAPLNVPDRATFYGGDHRGYTDYPVIEQAA